MKMNHFTAAVLHDCNTRRWIIKSQIWARYIDACNTNLIQHNADCYRDGLPWHMHYYCKTSAILGMKTFGQIHNIYFYESELNVSATSA